MSSSERYAAISPQDVFSSGLCIGCGGCVAQADTVGPQMAFDRYGQYKPSGPSSWLQARTPRLARTCPFSPAAQNEDELAIRLFSTAPHGDPRIGRFHAAYVGHVAEGDYRAEGSSGGMVSWVAAELLRQGMVDGVAHVVASTSPRTDGRFFHYHIARSEEEIRAGAKSRYYPVELSEVVRHIRATPGRYAVVGIPCFVKAVQLMRREDPILRQRVAFTLGLFCGHMKSARLVESFAWQMGITVDQIDRVEYRLKNPARPANWYTAQFVLRDGTEVSKDWWHLVDGDWGSGFFQHSACNFCDDVVAETADIAFGDAWVEPYSSDGRGVNVVVVRSRLLHRLIETAIEVGRLDLKPVDAEFVAQTQAAGFRQRREGLAYRLTWPHRGIRPRKRVTPAANDLRTQRKLIYRVRSHISAWSHRVFWAARVVKQPAVYIYWARAVVAVYHGLAYSRGRLGRLFASIRLS